MNNPFKTILSNTNKKKKAQILKYVRIVVQIIFFVIFPALFSQAFGAVKEVITCMKDGKVLHMGEFVIAFIILCAVTITFGRIFCGWACAFGAFGDFVFFISSYIHKKMKKRMFKIPDKALRIMQMFKYIVLVSVVLLCYGGKGELVTKYSPWTVFSLITVRNKMFLSYKAAIVILIFIVIGMAVKERFFCQFICPLGAIFSLLPNAFMLIFNRDNNACIKGCKACKNNCPVGIKLSENHFADGECIGCARCINTCPKGNIGFVRKRTNKAN